MTTSESIHELATALAKAQGAIAGASKSSANPFFKSRYADLASVWDACRGPLSEHGISIVQSPNTEYLGEPVPYEWTSKTGDTRYGVRVVCIVSVVTRLMHSSGQWIEDRVSTMLPTGDPQSVGSAITYLRRYALQSFAGVAPEDDDAEAAHGRGPQARANALATPEGYDAWLLGLQATSKNGTAALQAAWACSTPEFRRHLSDTNQAKWNSLKDIASKVLPMVATP